MCYLSRFPSESSLLVPSGALQSSVVEKSPFIGLLCFLDSYFLTLSDSCIPKTEFLSWGLFGCHPAQSLSDLFAGVTCTNNFMNASNFKTCKSWVLVFSPEDSL